MNDECSLMCLALQSPLTCIVHYFRIDLCMHTSPADFVNALSQPVTGRTQSSPRRFMYVYEHNAAMDTWSSSGPSFVVMMTYNISFCQGCTRFGVWLCGAPCSFGCLIIGELEHWCWSRRSGVQSAFQLIPDVFSGVEVRGVCWTLEFFRSCQTVSSLYAGALGAFRLNCSSV